MPIFVPVFIFEHQLWTYSFLQQLVIVDFIKS